jgi:hypothetical protein
MTTKTVPTGDVIFSYEPARNRRRRTHLQQIAQARSAPLHVLQLLLRKRDLLRELGQRGAVRGGRSNDLAG